MHPEMVNLKKSLLKIIEFIDQKDDVIYLDYPLHHNVGDLLIMEGALKLFKENGVKFKLYQSTENFDLSKIKSKLTNKTTIICHGGGNFGDLYDIHQDLRKDVVANLPNNKIIIMPQTAHYSSAINQEKDIQIFSRHKNLVMFARDVPTFELFKKYSNNVMLMADTAHYLYNSFDLSNKNKECLYFLRKDKEMSSSQSLNLQVPNDVTPIDWEDMLTRKDEFMFKLSRKLAKISKNYPFLNYPAFLLWKFHSKNLTNRSASYFSSFNHIVTSRMHGHILACLVDTDNTIIDNSYGKNSGYYKQWTYPSKISKLTK